MYVVQGEPQFQILQISIVESHVLRQMVVFAPCAASAVEGRAAMALLHAWEARGLASASASTRAIYASKRPMDLADPAGDLGMHSSLVKL